MILRLIPVCLLSISLHAAPRLDRLNLLQFRDGNGKVQSVKTPADWQKRRAETIKGMIAVMGKLSGKNRRVDLVVKVEEKGCPTSARRCEADH